MAKRGGVGKANRLRTEEAEALVRESLNSVYGPGPGDFVSKRSFGSGDMAEELRRIPWFAHCEEPREFDLTMPVERVKSWSQAMRALKSRAWETATLEARNQLTAYLSQHHRERNREWNKITDRLKRGVVNPLTKEAWEPFRLEHELDVKLLHSIQWNILAALMENAYSDCRHGCFFFHELLTVYAAGHLPCGWIGKWPQGKLVVY